MSRLTSILTDIGIWIGGIFLFGASLVITGDVLVRKFFSISFEGLHEISGFAMAVTFAWAMPFTILTRGHVRVDVLYGRLQPRARLVLDFAAALAMVFYLAILVQHCLLLTTASWNAGTLSSGILGLPLVVPQSLWTAGLAVACIVLVIALLRAANAIRRGQLETAHDSLAPYAMTSTDAEIDLDQEDPLSAGQSPR